MVWSHKLGTFALCVCLMQASCNRGTQDRPSRLPSQVVLFDQTGKEQSSVTDPKTISEMASLIAAAPHEKDWSWTDAEVQAKLSFRMADGAEQRFILMKSNRLIEIGPEPRKACRRVATVALLEKF